MDDIDMNNVKEKGDPTKDHKKAYDPIVYIFGQG
jgi:hypothetical protein